MIYNAFALHNLIKNEEREESFRVPLEEEDGWIPNIPSFEAPLALSHRDTIARNMWGSRFQQQEQE